MGVSICVLSGRIVSGEEHAKIKAHDSKASENAQRFEQKKAMLGITKKDHWLLPKAQVVLVKIRRRSVYCMPRKAKGTV